MICQIKTVEIGTLFVLLFTVAYSSPSFSSARFNELRIRDGLPSQTIWSVKQDQQGMVWLGTTHGLVRYDGREIKTFLEDTNQPDSLSDNTIKSLLVTKNGNLWVGTYKGGLNLLDRNTYGFTSFQSTADSKQKLSSNHVLSLAEATNGDIWIGTYSGLNRLSVTTGKITYLGHSDGKALSLPSQTIAALIRTNDSKLWVGTSKGVVIYDEEKNSLTQFNIPSTPQPSVRAFYESNNGDVWIGTEKGLFHHSLTEKVTKLVSGIPKKGILSLTADHRGNIWVGTRSEGVFLVSTTDIQSITPSTNFRYDKGTEYSLNDNVIMSLFTDYSGVVWLGTYSAGLNWLDPNTLNFGFVDGSVNGLSCLKSPIIYSIFEDIDRSLWIGTRNGVAHIAPLGDCEVFRHDPNDEYSLSSNEVHKIFRDSRDQIWLATAKGINRFDQKEQNFERFGDSFPSIRIYDINETTDHKLLIGSVKGLYVEGAIADQFSKVDIAGKQMDSISVGKIALDKYGKILVGTSKGLFFYKHSSGVFDYLESLDGTLITDPIRALYIDLNNSIWIGLNETGLVRLDHEYNMKHFNEKNGLPKINVFSGILGDQNGNLWISTGLNLIKFNPTTAKARKYTTDDGLQSDVFVRRAEYKASDGRLYFGGYNGFNHFNPSEIVSNRVEPKITLTHFYHFGDSIVPTKNNSEFSLQAPISDLSKLELSHRDNDFGFSFSALHFSDYANNKYAYKMDGFDQDWRYTDSLDRKAIYTNLPAGNYVFRVKASNKDNLWSKDSVALNVSIAPAPWLTWWAFFLYLIFTLIALYLIVRKRTQVLATRARLLQDTVDERTRELVQEKSKVEQLLSRKNEEFANVSHELRTPLTLILGPLAEVLKTNKDTHETNRLNIVQRNGYRLLRMVDQLLNLETFRVKSITQKTSQPTGEIIEMLAEAFSDLAREKSIQLNIKKIEKINFDFTNDALEKIIANLLSNAIKYTPSKGVISINSYRSSCNQLIIEIEDSGIGIPSDKIELVFQRYHRILDENSEQVTGAGIGLALVKNLVEAHGGEIQIESELGQGTKAMLSLPIINEVKRNQVKYHKNNEIVALELMGISTQSVPTYTFLENQRIDTANEKPSVLVIEDNRDMRLFIAEKIQEEFQVLSAKDGQQGIEIAIAEVPDLIISDIMMPNKDGYQVTNELRRHHITNHIPIILLTAREDRESRLKGWYEQADEYLTKPFDSEELKIRLHNLLGIRNILKARFSQTAFEGRNRYLETPRLPEGQLDEQISLNSKVQEEFIEKLNAILEKDYTNPNMSVSIIASEFAMSERQLFRKTKSIVDMTPIDYLRRYRIEKGRELLKQGKSASYATVEIGFTSQSYFGKCFKAQYGMTPREFMKKVPTKNS
jgi:ligand-binding sensor domain-containing protein/signal transduction histidine kinase/DNA-binding response OmpR family regulator